MYRLVVYDDKIKVHDIKGIVNYSIKDDRLYYHYRDKKDFFCSGLIRLNERFLLRVVKEV